MMTSSAIGFAEVLVIGPPATPFPARPTNTCCSMRKQPVCLVPPDTKPLDHLHDIPNVLGLEAMQQAGKHQLEHRDVDVAEAESADPELGGLQPTSTSGAFHEQMLIAFTCVTPVDGGELPRPLIYRRADLAICVDTGLVSGM